MNSPSILNKFLWCFFGSNWTRGGELPSPWTSRKLNCRLCENYPVHGKGKKLGRAKNKIMQGFICQIRLGPDFVVEPNVCSVCPD